MENTMLNGHNTAAPATATVTETPKSGFGLGALIGAGVGGLLVGALGALGIRRLVVGPAPAPVAQAPVAPPPPQAPATGTAGG